MVRKRDLFRLAAAAALVSAGCKMVSQSQYSAIQSQNRALTEQTRSQLAEIENLKVHVAARRRPVDPRRGRPGPA